MRHLLLPALVLALAPVLGLGCSHGRFDPFNKGSSFDDAQKRFTQALRWNQLAMASQLVEPDDRARFLDEAEIFEGMRFTDYDVMVNDLGDDMSHATVDVRFYAYSVTTLVERAITVHQVWKRDRKTGQWWVTPELQFDALPAKAGMMP